MNDECPFVGAYSNGLINIHVKDQNPHQYDKQYENIHIFMNGETDFDDISEMFRSKNVIV